MTTINNATSWSITRVTTYTPGVINYAPREHLWYRLHLQSSLTIVIYDHHIFIVQVKGA
jgi:hypothetical protein